MVRIGDDDWDDEPSDCALTLAGDCIGHVIDYDYMCYLRDQPDDGDLAEIAYEKACAEEDAALARMAQVSDCSWLS